MSGGRGGRSPETQGPAPSTYSPTPTDHHVIAVTADEPAGRTAPGRVGVSGFHVRHRAEGGRGKGIGGRHCNKSVRGCPYLPVDGVGPCGSLRLLSDVRTVNPLHRFLSHSPTDLKTPSSLYRNISSGILGYTHTVRTHASRPLRPLMTNVPEPPKLPPSF